MVFYKKLNGSQFILNILFCSIGCFACYYLQKQFELSSVLSSVLVGLIASFIPINKLFDSAKATAAIYCGSFSAMCALSYFYNQLDVFILCLLVGIYFNICSPFFRGVGGKLGSIAFLSSLTFVFIKSLI